MINTLIGILRGTPVVTVVDEARVEVAKSTIDSIVDVDKVKGRYMVEFIGVGMKGMNLVD